MLKNLKIINKEITRKVKGNVLEQLVISFFFVSIIYLSVSIIFGDKINTYLAVINMITIKDDGEPLNDNILTFDSVSKKLNNYPVWGSIFASLEIPDININLPVYHGDTLDILKHGIGHFSGSFFPGEGGSIILDGHNTRGFLYHLPEIKLNSLIYLKTTYGTYEYKVINTKIIGDQNMNDLPIKNDEEILMIYTCYPVNTIGHKNHRFVVYAKLVGDENEK